MKEIALCNYRQNKFLLVLVLVLCGCATVRLSEKPDSAKVKTAINQGATITADVLNFIDLKEIDLDNDGENEIVAIYNAGFNLRGVKIIKINDKAGKKLIFARVFNTNDLRLEIKNGVVVLVVNEQDSAGCGLKKFYVWEGKEFYQRI